jgi:predicted RNase H-like HicB family nuclease
MVVHGGDAMLDHVYAYIIKLVVEKDDDESYYAHVPGLRGINVSGETAEEALNKAKKDVENILRIRVEKGQTLPESEHIIALRAEPISEPIPLKDFVDDSYLFTVPSYLAKQLTERESRV